MLHAIDFEEDKKERFEIIPAVKQQRERSGRWAKLFDICRYRC